MSKQQIKKILFIITKAETGGAQNHIDLLIKHLPHHYRFILCSGSGGPLSEHAKNVGVEVHIVPQLQSKLFLPALIAIYQLIKSERPDMIHTHSAVASFVGRFAGRLAKVKTLYTVHGWHFVPNSVWKRRVFGWLLEIIARPFTSAWISVSAYDLKLGVNSGVMRKQNAYVIPNGVDDIDVVTDKKHQNELALVFVARASFQKNCLAAIDILERCDKKVSLTMYVTSGDHFHALKQRIETSKVGHRVCLIADDPAASTALHEYDAVLLTSRYEGMPLCVLEAMRAGLAVVATDVCGMSEIVEHGETGFLYQLGDSQEAAKRIDHLFDLDIRQRMSNAARIKFEDNFRAQAMAQRTSEVYEQLLAD